MNQSDLKQKCLELIQQADAIFLSTIDSEGYPQTRAMVNLHNKTQFPHAVPFIEKQDDFSIYFTTHNHSEKMKQLNANPKVSAYFCNAKAFHGLMLAGEIESVTDPVIKKTLWDDEWTIHYPGGVDGPECGILRLKPTMAKGWYHSSAYELDLGNQA